MNSLWNMGWTCPNCGAHVPNGTSHFCWPQPTYPAPSPQQPSITLFSTDEETKELLRKIIGLLEQLVKEKE